MKAKYGKTSIGCFIAHAAACVAFCMFAQNDAMLGAALATYLLCNLLGVVFAVVGAVKKESPMAWYCAGFFLNIALWVWAVAASNG